MFRTLLRHLRYTRYALLIFGLGVICGFVAVVGEISRLELPSSAVMALGLVLVPIGLFADGHGFVLLRWIARRFPRQPPPKPRARTRAAKPAAKPKAAAAKPSVARKPAKPRNRDAPLRPRRKRR
jgi:hypothetical protein